MNYSNQFLANAVDVIGGIDPDKVEAISAYLSVVREEGGRVFVLGLGGSAATASHFVNDLRKLCNIEAYCPTDNVAEYSARVNDDGRVMTLAPWLKVSRLSMRDAVFIISVGGGAPGVSESLIAAANLARECGAALLAVLGRDGGAVAKLNAGVVIIPPFHPDQITPLTEGLASVILHAIVSHPQLQIKKATW